MEELKLTPTGAAGGGKMWQEHVGELGDALVKAAEVAGPVVGEKARALAGFAIEAVTTAATATARDVVRFWSAIFRAD